MSQKNTRTTGDAIRRTLPTLVLLIGAALPVAIAFFLVAASDDGDNPLDRIPEYEDPIQETVTLPFRPGETVRTAFRYRDSVRLVIEGTATGETGPIDAFYRIAGAAGTAPDQPVRAPSALAVNGEPLLAALGLTADPPPFAPDHVYTGLYDAGASLRYLMFRVSNDVSPESSGQFTITVIQLK